MSVKYFLSHKKSVPLQCIGNRKVIIGNPVKFGGCTRSCKSQMPIVLRHCFGKSIMGRHTRRDEPEDLPLF